MSGPPKKPLSLYGHLLHPEQANPGTTISSAPVLYNTTPANSASETQKKKDGTVSPPPPSFS